MLPTLAILEFPNAPIPPSQTVPATKPTVRISVDPFKFFSPYKTERNPTHWDEVRRVQRDVTRLLVSLGMNLNAMTIHYLADRSILVRFVHFAWKSVWCVCMCGKLEGIAFIWRLRDGDGKLFGVRTFVEVMNKSLWLCCEEAWRAKRAQGLVQLQISPRTAQTLQMVYHIIIIIVPPSPHLLTFLISSTVQHENETKPQPSQAHASRLAP